MNQSNLLHPALLYPALYQATQTSGKSYPATLHGGVCQCGHKFFPMQTYGCERCGADGDALTTTTLNGRGVLRAAATVHRHRDYRALEHVRERVAPFVVGVIELSDGPVVRAVLEGAREQFVRGANVVATLVDVSTGDGGTGDGSTGDGNSEDARHARGPLFDLRFVLAD
jgi:uncharacterized protein